MNSHQRFALLSSNGSNFLNSEGLIELLSARLAVELINDPNYFEKLHSCLIWMKRAKNFRLY